MRASFCSASSRWCWKRGEFRRASAARQRIAVRRCRSSAWSRPSRIAQIGRVGVPEPQRAEHRARVEPVLARGLEHRPERAHRHEFPPRAGAGVAEPDAFDVPATEERGMHRVEFHERIVDDEDARRRLDHVGGVAVAVGEGGAAHGDEAVVPFGHVRIERRLRSDRDHRGARGRDRESRGRIAARARAEEDHPFEILQQALVHQPVEIAEHAMVAEPCGLPREKRQVRPAERLGDLDGQREARGIGRARAGHRVEVDQKRVGRIAGENSRMGAAQRLEMPLRLAEGLYFGQPLVVSQLFGERKVATHSHTAPNHGSL
jgi:hypothetical protein